VKKSITIGIIAAIIVVLSALSIGILSQIDDFKESLTGTTSEESADKIREKSKPLGKELSIELEEKLGLSAP